MGEPISKRRVLDPAHRPPCRRAGHRQSAALLCLVALAAPAACSPQTDATPAPDAGPVNHCTMHVVGDRDSGLGTLDYQESLARST